MPTTVADVLAKSVSGAAGLTRGDDSHTESLLPANVGDAERVASLVGGAVLLGYGLTCRGLAGVLLPLVGGSLVLRGATGSCACYQALGINTNTDSNRRGVAAGHGVKVEESVTIDKPAGELFAFWRQLDRLPQFMTHLKEVRMLGDGRSHWVARGPLGVSVEWDAEVVNERAGELIAWQSLPGSDVNTAGSVHFTPGPGNRGTRVRVELKYDPPAGKLGIAVARLLGEDAHRQVREDLQRFKELMEGGGRATAPGQAGGRSGTTGGRR